MKDKPSNRPIGRPRKTLNDLPENWKQIMFDLAQDGDGPTAWKVHLGLGHDTYNTLLTDYDEFSTAVKEAAILHEHYYERQAKRMINGGAGNSNVFSLIVNNKFGWLTNKNDLRVVAEIKADVVSATRDLTADELRKELAARGLPSTLLIEKDDDK